jgi:hypothetical protein
MEDKIFSKLGRYVFESSLLQEKLAEQEAEIERLKEIIKKKEE